MSHTAVAGDDFAREPLRRRFARLRRRAGARIKSFFRSAWELAKYAGRTTVHGAVAAAKVAGRGVLKGVTYIGLGATWLVRGALAVVTIAFTTTTGLVITGIGVICFGIGWALSSLTDLTDTYVYGRMLWLAQGRYTEWAEFRDDRILARMLWAERLADKAAGRKVTGTLEEDIDPDKDYDPVRPPVMDLSDPTLPVRPNVTHDEAGFQLNERTMRTLAEVESRTDIVVTETFEEPSAKVFPGADVVIVDGENPFAGGALFEPRFQALVDMAKHEDLGESAVTFDFKPYLNEKAELAAAFEYLSYTAGTMQMRSYWRGRAEMLNFWRKFDERQDYIAENGKLWALINAHYKTQQREFSLRNLRTGFMDQIHDVEKEILKV